MKKLISLSLAAVLVITLTACGGPTTAEPESDSVTTEAAAAQPDITATETTEKFSITTEDGVVSNKGNIYTISSDGKYTISGLLEGQILVDAEEEDTVVLELSGTTVTNSKDSPIKIVSAGKVDISANNDTENVINDKRSAKTEDDKDQGEGAIYANCDLKFKGTGTLVVTASYNNGIHTTKDMTIQNISLKSSARNNALKGNDSVTVNSGNIIAISTNRDGIRTENTDVNKNNVTRGDITLSGGTVTVYAAGDGFQAAHDFNMNSDEDVNGATVTVYTGDYSQYTASNASTSSYKGIKVQNELNIEEGNITIQSYDDGLHADYGNSFDDGTKGLGTINISGGTINMNVYAPENKTPGGRKGPGSWSGQKTVAGADGIHADNIINISGGEINIDSAYEGLEANAVNISGGKTYVYANDDGVNACKGNDSALVNVTGGYLDVTVSPSSDTDGIDSNGNYRQSGGVVITRGPSRQMAAAIDADGLITIYGGTLIVLGYGNVNVGTGIKTYNLSLGSSGSHTVSIGDTAYTFTNASDYGNTSCYSDVPVSA